MPDIRIVGLENLDPNNPEHAEALDAIGDALEEQSRTYEGAPYFVMAIGLECEGHDLKDLSARQVRQLWIERGKRLGLI